MKKNTFKSEAEALRKQRDDLLRKKKGTYNKTGNVFKDLIMGILTVMSIIFMAVFGWLAAMIAPFLGMVVGFLGCIGAAFAAVIGAVWAVGRGVNKVIDKR